MQKTYLLLLVLCCNFSLLAQNKMRYKSVHAATSFTYFSAFPNYENQYTFTVSPRDETELTYETPTSGTFVIIPGEELTTTVVTNHVASIPQLAVGASVQIANEDRLYHEISLTRLSFQSDIRTSTYIYSGSSIKEPEIRTDRGVERRSFTSGLRYELGRYAKQNRKHSPWKFSLGVAVETTYFHENYTPLSSLDFPWRTRLLRVELSIVPTLGVRLSKKVSLDVKLLPNIVLANIGSVQAENPILAIRQREASGDYDSPQLNMVTALMLRYEVKPAERRRYRRKK